MFGFHFRVFSFVLKDKSQNFKAKFFFFFNLFKGVCNVLKRISGSWISVEYTTEVNSKISCGFQDGEKLLCMDGLYKAVQNQTCLVYSFGLANDWNFEVLMAELGMYNSYSQGSTEVGQSKKTKNLLPNLDNSIIL